MPRLYKPGSFLRIPLADGSFGYGRVLKLPHDAYYNYRTETSDSDLERIASQPILFKISVRHMKERGWELIGWRRMEEQFSQPIVQFMQDIGNFRDCTIFDTAGNSRRAEPQECIGLDTVGPCLRSVPCRHGSLAFLDARHDGRVDVSSRACGTG